MLEAKLIIQSLWKLNIDWDDAIPDNNLNKYELWSQKLEFMECVNVNRWLGFRDDPPQIE